jgi:ubiquinone/menaquinone biosynthesis C-methylase UbiE
MPKVMPGYIRKHKQAAELDFWVRQRRDLLDWFDGKRDNWWGLPSPSDAEKVLASSDRTLNAVLTAHRLRAAYLEQLQLPADHFHGKRVLEVGCGPMAPILQFTDCERYGLDPLVERYQEAGYPLGMYDVKFLCAGAEKIPTPDNFFDAVISVNAIDHVDDFAKAALEMQRVLKPNGFIYMEVEYHEATFREPLELSDSKVLQAFHHCQMRKICDRGKREVFELAKSLADLVTNSERLVVWHGQKMVNASQALKK